MKKIDQNIAPFYNAIQAVQRLLAKFNHRGVIIGGIAVGFLGKPRYTADVDAMFLLSTDDIPQFLESASAEKIIPRIEAAAEFARRNRVMLLKHIDSDTPIDISLGIMPFEEETIERSKIYSFDGLKVRLPTPEDLIIMKAVAHRPKDLEDIRSIVGKQQKLDHARIELWVKAFAEILELPDLWGQINKILEGQ